MSWRCITRGWTASSSTGNGGESRLRVDSWVVPRAVSFVPDCAGGLQERANPAAEGASRQGLVLGSLDYFTVHRFGYSKSEMGLKVRSVPCTLLACTKRNPSAV